MLTDEKEQISATLTIRIAERQSAGKEELLQYQEDEVDHESAAVCGPLFELVRNAPATFAERFPRLMVTAVAVAVLLAALTAEIDCLRGSGYYWR